VEYSSETMGTITQWKEGAYAVLVTKSNKERDTHPKAPAETEKAQRKLHPYQSHTAWLPLFHSGWYYTQTRGILHGQRHGDSQRS